MFKLQRPVLGSETVVVMVTRSGQSTVPGRFLYFDEDPLTPFRKVVTMETVVSVSGSTVLIIDFVLFRCGPLVPLISFYFTP